MTMKIERFVKRSKRKIILTPIRAQGAIWWAILWIENETKPTTWQRDYKKRYLSHLIQPFCKLFWRHFGRKQGVKESDRKYQYPQHCHFSTTIKLGLNSMNFLAHSQRQLIITPSIEAVSRCLVENIVFLPFLQRINARCRHLSSAILK